MGPFGASLSDSPIRPLVRLTGGIQARPGVFPAGKGQPNDPTQPVTTLRTAWTKVRDKAKVVGRWHDNRHTLVTELAESGTASSFWPILRENGLSP